MPERFAIDDGARFAEWLAQQPRALVLYFGVGCIYSAAFHRAFEREAPAGWAVAVRDVEEGGRGPVAEAAGVKVTPTVGAFRDGQEERLEARQLLGIGRRRYANWVRKLG